MFAQTAFYLHGHLLENLCERYVSDLPSMYSHCTIAVRDRAASPDVRRVKIPYPYEGSNLLFVVGKDRHVVLSDTDALTRGRNKVL